MINPKTFVQLRFSPVFSIFVEEDVDSLMRESGISFFELSKFLMIKASRPIRIMNIYDVRKTLPDEFFNDITKQISMFSNFFLQEEFEEKDEIFASSNDNQSNKFQRLMPKFLHFPSKESMNPPWFQLTFKRMIQANYCQNFNFCDLPMCIIYVSLHGKQSLDVSEIKAKLDNVPEWMSDYIDETPIYHVVLYDALSISDQDVKPSKDGYNNVFTIPFRTRNKGEEGGVDRIDIRNLFNTDSELCSEILNRENLFEYMTDKDLKAFRKCFSKIYSAAHDILSKNIKILDAEITKNKKIKNVVNRWINKKKLNEKTTSFLNIPHRKIIRLQLGCYYMLDCNYIPARKILKKFVKCLKNIFPELRIAGQYMIGMSALAAISTLAPEASSSKPGENSSTSTQKFQKEEGKFKGSITNVINNISLIKNPIFFIEVPIINAELSASQGNYQEASYYYQEAIRKIKHLWNDQTTEHKNLILAILYERLAGITTSERHSLLATAISGIYYSFCNQIAHSLRCLIWVIKALPSDSWPILYQNALMLKAQTLASINFFERSLKAYQTLLSFNNLDPTLQLTVIKEFWLPFNQSEIANNFKVHPLLEIKNITVTDNSNPEFWGINYSSFEDMIEFFKKKHQVSNKGRITLEKWFETKDSSNKTQNIATSNQVIPVNLPFVVNIEMHNRYCFSINLQSTRLCVSYVNTPDLENDSEPSEDSPELVSSKTDVFCDIKEVPPRSLKKFSFKILPKVEGKYTIERLVKNYWGYTNTDIKCGPITFMAKNECPQVSMMFHYLPDSVELYSITRFAIAIKNTNQINDIDNFEIVIDHPNLVISETMETEYEDGFSIIKINTPLKKNDVHTISLLLHAKDDNNSGTIKLRALVSFENHILSYATKTIQINKNIEILTKYYTKSNDYLNKMIHCSFSCLSFPGIKVYGIINENCKFLSVSKGKIHQRPLEKNETFSFISFTENEMETGVEEWRSKLMRTSQFQLKKSKKVKIQSYALIFQYPESRIPAQYPINISKKDISEYSNISFNSKLLTYKKESPRLKLELPPIVKIIPGAKYKCRVYLDQNQDDFENIYIDPKPITVINMAGPPGCRWVGKVRSHLSKENNFSAEFNFIPKRIGIFCITGFLISNDEKFETKYDIPLVQSFQVIYPK